MTGQRANAGFVVFGYLLDLGQCLEGYVGEGIDFFHQGE
jgi:hypothetical protein